jgi:hypothetical protein
MDSIGAFIQLSATKPKWCQMKMRLTLSS